LKKIETNLLAHYQTLEKIDLKLESINLEEIKSMNPDDISETLSEAEMILDVLKDEDFFHKN
jgi:hypothetical protein